MSEIIDSVGRARTNGSLAIDRVSAWFVPLGRQAMDKKYTLEQIVRIGEVLTTNARPTFVPKIHLQNMSGEKYLTAHTGAFAIADALFIAFDNVYLHSGLSNPVDVNVHISNVGDGFLKFRIENEIAESVDASVLASRLDQIRVQLQSGEYRKKISGEGGTGLFKLRRFGDAPAFEGKSNVDFGIDDGRFSVEFMLSVVFKDSAPEGQTRALETRAAGAEEVV